MNHSQMLTFKQNQRRASSHASRHDQQCLKHLTGIDTNMLSSEYKIRSLCVMSDVILRRQDYKTKNGEAPLYVVL